MEHRALGALQVSVIGLGTNNFGLPTAGLPPVGAVVCDQARTTAIVRAALDAGVTFIDTAEEYALGEAESFIGAALGARRDEAVLATKFGSHHSPTPGHGAGAERVVRSVEGSLRRLGTDRIDLLQLHFPDPTTPVDETLEAMDRLVTDGKVREVGCCNFTSPLLDEAADAAAAAGLRPFASAQNPYSIL
ncbi:MAG: aldo/keto reductase, partial [Actinomycetia bacterium]|nr:aldo/keto reductase [Actinomycetes bacterium]